MSKAALRQRASKQAEAEELVAQAAENFKQAQAMEEAQKRVESEQRLLGLFGECRKQIINEPALWPGDHIGAVVAEVWLHEAYTQMLARVQAQQAET